MRAMQLLMETPNAMQDWLKKQAFDALPED